MHLNFLPYYKQYGLRRIPELLTPTFMPADILPRGAVVYYLTHDPVNLDVDPTKRFISTFKKVYIDFHTDISAATAGVRDKTFNPIPLIRDFVKANRNFRFMKDAATTITDLESLIILNYNYIYKAHVYPKTPFAQYSQWKDAETTRFDTMHQLSKTTSRQHFVFFYTPDMLLSKSLLDRFATSFNVSSLRVVDTHEEMLLLEFWKWINPVTRATTIFRSLDKQSLPKINIILTSRATGRTVLINLGYLYSWIKGSPNLTEFPNIKQLDTESLQKMFLRLLMSLNSVDTEEDVDETASLDPAVNNPEEDLLDDTERNDAASTSYLTNKTIPNKSTPDQANPTVDLTDKDLGTAGFGETDLEKQLSDLDADLNELEVVNKKRLQSKKIHIDEKGDATIGEDIPETISRDELLATVMQPKTPQDKLMASLDEQVEYGLITAADYRKLSKEIAAYPETKDPYGTNRPIKEVIDLKPEDYVLSQEEISFVKPSQVADTSMATSTLAVYDSKYIKETMSRHTVAVVSSLQNAGMVIRKHEVQTETSILGGYESHLLEIKPIDGMPSTLRFRLPIVNEDGSFLSGGNKYSMRKQRADVPIRKISPTEVALSSYYGKTFVQVNPKVANSSLAWLFKRIHAAFLDDTSKITDVAPAKVFDNNFKAPYMYSALSTEFKSFRVGNVQLMFDHKERGQLLKEMDKLSNYEKDGELVCGKFGVSAVITIDRASNFHVYSPEGKRSLGNIFSICGLNQNEAPVDFSEVTLFKKAVPVGIMLGYYLGFKNLMTLLGEEGRWIPKNTRGLGLQQGEFIVRFSDGAYVFNTDNRVNALILGGFTEVVKTTRMYAAEEFDKKDVYFNILQSLGMSSMYVREMDNLNDLFVDPITADVLKQMNEPVTWQALLLRSTELLTKYYHPDSQDHNFMRERGYERFPGAVYKKIAQAIRQYRNKNYAGKSKVDMGHYEIQNFIAQDSSVKIVEDINPIQCLKEREIVTYVGEGGRAKEAMNRASRAYHASDMGIISEATVDSGDVGINAFTSANPQIQNTLGLPMKDKTINATSLLSTSSLLNPGAVNDDQNGPIKL